MFLSGRMWQYKNVWKDPKAVLGENVQHKTPISEKKINEYIKSMNSASILSKLSPNQEEKNQS